MSTRLTGSLTLLIFSAGAFGQANESQFNSIFGNVSGAPATVTLVWGCLGSDHHRQRWEL